MKYPNLSRRGHLFWWRRKVMIGGVTIPLDLPLRTANFYEARATANRLSVALESLKMAYGERGNAISAATLKRIFQDAMRWQLERIRSDQIGSPDPVEEHALINAVFAEVWRAHARDGVKAFYTTDHDTRLASEGWTTEERALVENHLRYHRETNVPRISARQLNHYVRLFGFELTGANRDRVERVIYSARASACDQATRELGEFAGDLSRWADDAMADSAPFAFESMGAPVEASPQPGLRPAEPSPQQTATVPDYPRDASAQPTKAKKALMVAMAECLEAYERNSGWSRDTKEQVRTAIRLFDFACGEGVLVEDITPEHVAKFKALCGNLPNRWGKSKAELEGGLQASLLRAETMDPSLLGMSQATINKHFSWISSVLAFAALPEGGRHKPDADLAVAEAIKQARKSLGKKGGKSDVKRSRDKRAAWTPAEIRHLLSAPVWTGCHSLDSRFEPGDHVYHDGTYWLPLMLPLYGGRSSELVGLPLVDVHEDSAIPFFKIDYSELRALKTIQSVRNLPIHPELIRLGFLDYVRSIRATGHTLLFPELHNVRSLSFASTFYKSVFSKWRHWAFPDGTNWRHRERGAVRDKDVHSFRGAASTLMKGKVPDSIRIDIIGHEGENETMRTYDEEASLADKLNALQTLTPLTEHIPYMPLNLRPAERQRHGARRGRQKISAT